MSQYNPHPADLERDSRREQARQDAEPRSEAPKDSTLAVGWHMSPTLNGKRGGRTHYDIGSDDNENIALVYPAEDGDEITRQRARAIAGWPRAKQLLKEAEVSVVFGHENPSDELAREIREFLAYVEKGE